MLVAAGVAAATVPVITLVGVAVAGRTVAVIVTVGVTASVAVIVAVAVAVAVGGRVLVAIKVAVAGSDNSTWVGEGTTVTGWLVAVAEGVGAAATSVVGSTSGCAPQLTRSRHSKKNRTCRKKFMVFTCQKRMGGNS